MTIKVPRWLWWLWGWSESKVACDHRWISGIDRDFKGDKRKWTQYGFTGYRWERCALCGKTGRQEFTRD